MAATGEPITFTTFGLLRSSARTISAANVAMSTAGSASGASRAWMSRGSGVGAGPGRNLTQIDREWRRLYGLHGARQTGYLSAADPQFRVWSLDAMDSFEMNKILGAILGTCLVLVALNITAGAVFTPGKML